MINQWARVSRHTATATPALKGASNGTLLFAISAVNGAGGGVQVSLGAAGAANIWEHQIASTTETIYFIPPFDCGAVNPTVTIAGAAVAYLYYGKY